jgi:hypothetical protein
MTFFGKAEATVFGRPCPDLEENPTNFCKELAN